MKTLKVVALLSMMFLAPALFAEEADVLFKPGEGTLNHGGFGGVSVKGTKINGEFAVLAGGRGAWIINQKWLLGGGGYGLTTRHRGETSDDLMDFGYGGIIVGRTFAPNSLIHMNSTLLIGGGGIGKESDEDYDNDDRNYKKLWVAEPEVAVTLNVVKNFRVELSGSYRFVNAPSDWNGIKDKDLSGFAVGVNFNFGSF